MIGRYALPLDDGAIDAAVSGSAEDSDYLAENLVGRSAAGLPGLTASRPAKLTTTTGNWTIDTLATSPFVAAALINHTIDAGSTVVLSANAGGFTIPIPIPTHHEDGWSVSPFVIFPSAQPYDDWILTISTPNSVPIAVGRLMLLTAIRDLENDVRWGVEEAEEHAIIVQPTELGVETIYELGGKQRAFSGELALRDTTGTAQSLITLMRSAHGRVYPWLLIPDVDVNDAWLVRFDENRWSRVRENPNHNIFPFRVKEVARGLPWP